MAANCGNVLDQVYDDDVRDLLMVKGYTNPAFVGDSIDFICSFGQVLTQGSNVSTCNRNGEWEPDPREIKYNGISGYCMIIHTLIIRPEQQIVVLLQLHSVATLFLIAVLLKEQM